MTQIIGASDKFTMCRSAAAFGKSLLINHSSLEKTFLYKNLINKQKLPIKVIQLKSYL